MSTKKRLPRGQGRSRSIDDHPPTERQLEILAFMRAYQESRGAPPALREIGTHFGIASTNGVSDHLRALHRKGLIRKHRGARSYVPVATVPTQSSPPWDACAVAFAVEDPAALDCVSLAMLPPGWALDGMRETPGAEGQSPRWAAIFRAPPAPSTEDGVCVLAVLRAAGARS